jgi:protein TonB
MAYGTNPPPPYPTTARRRGWEGEVLLLVNVTAQGEVYNVTVNHSSGYQILDRAALNAVYRWEFQAAQKNGRAVSGQVMVPIRFSIKDAQ